MNKFNLSTIAVIFTLLLAIDNVMCKDKHINNKYKEKDMMRKSIVFDKNTPDVFYCPVNKPASFEKLIVR
jgi:hypothetical protein